METVLTVSIDDKPLARIYGNYPAGSKLEASIPDATLNIHGGFQVVEMPLSDYEPDFETIKRQDGAEIDLGELASVTHRGTVRFSTQMAEDMLYDFFCLHEHFMDTGRIVTGVQSPPNRMTLEEIGLLLVLNSNLTLDQAKGVKATVIHDNFHLYNRNEYLHYGFQIGDMVATISSQDPLGLIYSYSDAHRNIEKFMQRVTRHMFANELRRIAGFPPLASQ